MDIVWVDESWWSTRSKVGLHVLNPTGQQVSVLKKLNSNQTVYCYIKDASIFTVARLK